MNKIAIDDIDRSIYIMYLLITYHLNNLCASPFSCLFWLLISFQWLLEKVKSNLLMCCPVQKENSELYTSKWEKEDWCVCVILGQYFNFSLFSFYCSNYSLLLLLLYIVHFCIYWRLWYFLLTISSISVLLLEFNTFVFLQIYI